MSDDELEQLLRDAGVAPSEIERCRQAFPEVKVILECVQSYIAGKIAEKIVDDYFQRAVKDN